jgi:phosphoglycerol transferase MdoB-like AlkP superfamily enzyme
MSFLNNLLSESYVFSNFYANVGMGVSSDAEFSVLTGLNPQGDQTLYWNYQHMAYDLPSIPKYLNANSYYTEVIHADLETFYNRHMVYPELYEFEEFYSLEDFIDDGYDVDKGYVYNHEEGLTHRSPWASDYYLADYTAMYGRTIQKPFMLFPIYMMGHTPFYFGPHGVDETIYNDYVPFIKEITLKYLNYANYYSETMKRFFISEQGDDQTLDDTVYVFYSDHGSGLKNGDLDYLFNRKLEDLEERQILQQTLAFIYVPSNDTYTDFGEYQLRKGMLVGDQKRVRSHIDLYRTMIELFAIPVENDLYFGVNGLSTEPTFALDNRILDVVTDAHIYSLRNPNKVYPYTAEVDTVLYDYIITYKMFSDYVLATPERLKEINNLLNNRP